MCIYLGVNLIKYNGAYLSNRCVIIFTGFFFALMLKAKSVLKNQVAKTIIQGQTLFPILFVNPKSSSEQRREKSELSQLPNVQFYSDL